MMKQGGIKTVLMMLLLSALPLVAHALPARLVIALDGVAYRDMKALQAGITRTNFWGKTYQLRAFTTDEGYYPVSRMISTFPSASDVAWTDIFGDRPLPGYQRTYYSAAANSMIVLNGVTTTMEHERQMDFQVQNGLIRGLGYMFPAHTLRYEMQQTVVNFLRTKSQRHNYYVYIRASDDAQHMDRDIIKLLCKLDERLQKLRTVYQQREGHDLEIVILSDHGHNHAGRGIRVQDVAFLEKAGYHVGNTIRGPKDVVLPVVGIESWVEVHCYPAETESLAQKLCDLKGADLVTAIIPGQTNRFVVMNSRKERADIEWNRECNSFRYLAINGDPLNYEPVVDDLTRKRVLDADGFATADEWMEATMTNHYPLALERIARGLTRATLNPATIIISLDNRYVNDVWFTEKGSRLVTCRSTHGGLDDICSDGILLSNFKPTHDTSTVRVASQFEEFPAVVDYRALEGGGELVTKEEQSLVRIQREPFDQDYAALPNDGLYLRVWSPQLAEATNDAPVTVTVEKERRYSTSPPPEPLNVGQPVILPEDPPYERIYALPKDLKLQPSTEYKITGWLEGSPKHEPVFEFPIHTTPDGKPAAY